MYGPARTWKARGLCIAQLLAHILVSMNACVEIAVPIGSNEAGYAKTYLGASERPCYESVCDFLRVAEASASSNQADCS